jgi:hypothetical protein
VDETQFKKCFDGKVPCQKIVDARKVTRSGMRFPEDPVERCE